MEDSITIEELAKEAVEALKDEWEIGTSSRFCDDPPDWDSASDEDIAAKLIPFLERAKLCTPNIPLCLTSKITQGDHR